MTRGAVLVAAAEAGTRENLTSVLGKDGYAVQTAGSGEAALAALSRREFDLVLTDLRLKDVDGLAVLAETKRRHPETVVVVMTGYATVGTAVEAMRRGACHSLTKPFTLDEVRAAVIEAMNTRLLRLEVSRLSRQVADLSWGPLIIGGSLAMDALRRQVEHIAPSDSTVLLLGETGAGKELAARAIHLQSPRRGKRFLSLNCRAFTEERVASELFGHEKAAFPGAAACKKGILEAAGEGTIFLGEVEELPLAMQVRLLRVLQEGVFFRVGGTSEIEMRARVLAGAAKDLKSVVDRGLFRADLSARLGGITLRVPPLSERREDLPLLVGFFIARYAQGLGKAVRGLSEAALARLLAADFPGNIRELGNIVQRAVIMAKGPLIEAADLPVLPGEEPASGKAAGPDLSSLDDLERRHIAAVLEYCQGNKTRTAEILGIDRVSLWRKVKRYGVGG